jgi:chromosome segregation ATPase
MSKIIAGSFQPTDAWRRATEHRMMNAEKKDLTFLIWNQGTQINDSIKREVSHLLIPPSETRDICVGEACLCIEIAKLINYGTSAEVLKQRLNNGNAPAFQVPTEFNTQVEKFTGYRSSIRNTHHQCDSHPLPSKIAKKIYKIDLGISEIGAVSQITGSYLDEAVRPLPWPISIIGRLIFSGIAQKHAQEFVTDYQRDYRFAGEVVDKQAGRKKLAAAETVRDRALRDLAATTTAKTRAETEKQTAEAQLTEIQAERDKALSDLAAALAEKNQAIPGLAAAEEARDQALKDLTTASATREQAIAEKNLALENLKIAQDTLNIAQAKTQRLEKDLLAAQEKLRAAEEKLKISQETIESLEKALKSSQEVIERLQGDLSDAYAKIERLTGALHTAQETIERLTTDLSAAKDALKDSEEKRIHTKAKLGLAKAKITSLETSIESALKDVLKAQTERDAAIKELEDYINQPQPVLPDPVHPVLNIDDGRIAELEAKLAKARNKLLDVLKEKTELKDGLDAAKSDLQAALARESENTVKFTALQEQYNQVVEDKKNIAMELGQSKENIVTLESEKANVEQDLRTTQEGKHNAEAELSLARTNLEATALEITRIQTQLNQAQQDLQTEKAKTEEAKDELGRAKEDLLAEKTKAEEAFALLKHAQEDLLAERARTADALRRVQELEVALRSVEISQMDPVKQPYQRFCDQLEKRIMGWSEASKGEGNRIVAQMRQFITVSSNDKSQLQQGLTSLCQQLSAKVQEGSEKTTMTHVTKVIGRL